MNPLTFGALLLGRNVSSERMLPFEFCEVANFFIHKLHAIMLGTCDIYDIGGIPDIRGTPHQSHQTFKIMCLILELCHIPISQFPERNHSMN